MTVAAVVAFMPIVAAAAAVAVAYVMGVVAAVTVAYVMADKTIFGPILCILSLFHPKLHKIGQNLYQVGIEPMISRSRCILSAAR